MNNAEALAEINRIYDSFCYDGVHELRALFQIGGVLGRNAGTK
jgi:hypothetical protein